MKYEYKVVQFSQLSPNTEKELNKLGDEGWRLVAELDDNSPTHTLVFEREKK